jgi:DNA-binding response OmpR family regulator
MLFEQRGTLPDHPPTHGRTMTALTETALTKTAMSADRPLVLLVEDEPEISAFLAENLAADDFAVRTAASIAQARSRLGALAPDVVVLDVCLPDGSGFDLCRELRAADPADVRYDPEVPVVMLSARGDGLDRVRGFERGADDYVSKPFHYPELVARLRAVLRRRTDPRERQVLQAAGIVIDLRTREVRVGDVPVALSQKEFQLLAALAREPRRVFRKQDLLEEVWGYRSPGITRTLDSHASRLRRKLRPLSTGAEYVDNVWGVGYRLVAAAAVDGEPDARGAASSSAAGAAR